jgi:hypothetical protein
MNKIEILLDELDKLLTNGLYEKLKGTTEEDYLKVIKEYLPDTTLNQVILIKSAFEIRCRLDKDFMRCVDEVLAKKSKIIQIIT